MLRRKRAADQEGEPLTQADVIVPSPPTLPVDIDAGHSSSVPTLEEAYRALAPAVLAYFRSHRVDQPEDLVGEVFVSVARNFRRFRGDADDFRRWVFAIAHRRRVDHLRRWHVRRRVVIANPPERPTPGDAVGSAALDVDLVAALGELTPAQREVVTLRFVADLPLDDVARIVGRRTGAVKALQARALSQLAQRLEGCPGHPAVP
jgi:RNA polymerase sigma-70 factor, ECF subfamily